MFVGSLLFCARFMPAQDPFVPLYNGPSCSSVSRLGQVPDPRGLVQEPHNTHQVVIGSINYLQTVVKLRPFATMLPLNQEDQFHEVRMQAWLCVFYLTPCQVPRSESE